MRLSFFFAFCSVFLLLTGCSPVYQTTYSYAAPKSQTGKMCAMQCEQSKMLCQQLCDSKKENCRNEAKQRAFHSYEQYKSQQSSQGKPIEKTLNDFYSDQSCNSMGCSCTEDYHTCFTVCGGQVTPSTKCVAFCDKAPSNMR